MNDRLFALKLFSRVARTSNFSAAGRELGLSQPSASRIISELEKDVGVALLTRTTRAVSLTEAGLDYLARVEPLLLALDEADHVARGTGELKGSLRLGLSSSFAIREVIPRLPEFMAKHPALRVDLLMDDHRQDLIVDGVDVAFRFGALPDSSAVARPIGISQRLLAASPSYLERAGAPEIPSDLVRHSIIIGPTGAGAKGWAFKKDGRILSVRVEGRITATANEAATTAAICGLGIISTSVWGCRDELKNGSLVPVLSDWLIDPVEVNAVFPRTCREGIGARLYRLFRSKPAAGRSYTWSAIDFGELVDG